jgi:hypothetical protein
MKNPLKANIPLKKLLSIGFVAMLLLAIAMVMVPANAATVPAQSLWIDPTYPDPSVTNLEVSDTFTVDVMVNVTSPTSPSGTGMFAFEYTLFWNDSYITLTSRDIHNPTGWEPPAGFLVSDETGVWDKEWPLHLRPKKGLCYHWYGYSSITAPVFTGVMSLCTYTFTVTDQPISPAPAFNGSLELEEVKIVDDAIVTFIANRPGEEAGTVQDGMYEVASKVLTAPLLEVEPSLVEGVFGQNFTVNIRIEGLDAAFNLSSWEANLGYNTTMLDALVSAEGPFLQGFAGANGTYYDSTISDISGIVDMEGGFNGSYTEPSGSGVLATVTFNASWRYTIPPGVPPVTSAFNLYDTTLLDGAGLPITHDTTDGTYEAPYEDNSPPNIGDPSRTPAGDVLPGHAVTVSVNVTDAESDVKKVTLNYTINNGTSWKEVEMQLFLDSYVAEIPGQEAETWVKFNITAEDKAGNSATRDGAGVHFVYYVVPEFPTALIMPLFMIAALVAVILGKTAWSRKQGGPFILK